MQVRFKRARARDHLNVKQLASRPLRLAVSSAVQLRFLGLPDMGPDLPHLNMPSPIPLLFVPGMGSPNAMKKTSSMPSRKVGRQPPRPGLRYGRCWTDYASLRKESEGVSLNPMLRWCGGGPFDGRGLRRDG